MFWSRRLTPSLQNLLSVHRNPMKMTLLGCLCLCWSGFGTGMCNSHWFQPGRNTWIYGIILPGKWAYCISQWLTLNYSAVKPAEYFQSIEAFLCQFSYFRAFRSPPRSQRAEPKFRWHLKATGIYMIKGLTLFLYCSFPSCPFLHQQNSFVIWAFNTAWLWFIPRLPWSLPYIESMNRLLWHKWSIQGWLGGIWVV